MQELRQSTEMKIRIGSAVDATDGITPETTLALTTADQAELLKHNGAATVDISSNTFAAITGSDGWYDLTLSATDTNTLGLLTVVIQDSSLMVPIFKDFMVVTPNYWDSKYSTDAFDVNIISQANIDFGVLQKASIDAIWDSVLTGGTHNVADSAGKRLRELYDGNVTEEETAQGGSATTITLTSGSSALDDFYNLMVLSIVSGTGEGQARTIKDYNGTTKVATVCMNWVTEPDATSKYIFGFQACAGVFQMQSGVYDLINAECDTALTDYGANTTTPPTVIAIRTEMDANSTKMAPSQTLADYKATGFSIPNEYDSVLSAIQGTTFNASTDSLEAIRDRGDSAWLTGAGGSSPTVGEIRTEMETTGSKLSLALLDTDELQGNQSNWLTAAGFSVPNEYDTVIADIPTVAELNARTILAANYFDPAADTVANVTTVATNTDMVGTDNAALATALATHDNKLDIVDALVDRILTATEIRQSSVNDAATTTTKFITALTETDNDYWNRMALLFTSGNNSGQIRRIKDYVGATKEVTLQTPLNAAPANADTFVVLTSRAFITPDIDDIADAVLDELTSEHTGAGSLSANVTTIAAFNDISAADVNAEVVDAMTIDTIADSYAVDGNQPTLVQAVLAIHQMMQEKAITGTTMSVKKPDGSTTAMTFTLDDATTPTSITRAT